MRKVFILAIVFIMLFMATSCSVNVSTEKKILISMVQNITSCINEKDTNQIKTYFTSNAIETENFQKNCEDLIGLFEDKTVYATLINHTFEETQENGKKQSTYFCSLSLTTMDSTYYAAFSCSNSGKKTADYKIKSFYIVNSCDKFEDTLYWGEVYDDSKSGIFLENACDWIMEDFINSLKSSTELKKLFAVNICENDDYNIEDDCKELTELFDEEIFSYEIKQYHSCNKSEISKKENRHIKKICCEVTAYCTLINGNDLYDVIIVFSPVNQKKLGMVGINSIFIASEGKLQEFYHSGDSKPLGIHIG